MALPICGIYLAFGSLWILFSDLVLEAFATNTLLLTQLQTVKGWFFIVSTAALLYLLISRHNAKTLANEQLLLASNSELTAAYEELTAMDEELRQQCDSLNQELTERQKAEEALRASESQIHALIKAYPDCIMRLDGMGTILWYKQDRDFPLARFKNDNIVGSKINEFFPADLASRALHYIEETWRNKTNQSFEYEILIDDTLYNCEARLVSCGDHDVLCVLRDITARKQMELQLRYMGLYDSVTGLYNRLYFEEEMHRLESDRHCPVGLIICDLDGLKLINDTLGHANGDDLLKASAALIRDCFRTSDVVSRIGGDEFAILMPRTDLESTAQSCSRIKQAVEDYNSTCPPILISMSIGMAVKDTPDRPMAVVFKEADQNMYREKLQHTQSNRGSVVQTLVLPLEDRDFAADGHLDRLQDIVEAMGRALELKDNIIADLRLLGRFHDIGKVGIPDSILFKPAQLTDEEYTIMQRHSEIGYRIAQSSTELAPIADWILKHHERWDGSGYPLNLANTDIPLACRLLAIVDAYDAMTNNRPYRQAMSHSKAMAELRRCSGTQFDPELIVLFEKTMETRCK